MAAQKELLRKLLLRNKNKSRLWASLVALCIGTILLLCAVMIWWNFQVLLSGKGDHDSLGSSFLTISKKVTDEMMGKPEMTIFSSIEIDSFKHAAQVQDIGVLTGNHFPVYASINSHLGFGTEMFLEGVPDRFIDKIPEGWQWSPSSIEVPIILSAEFLNLYNYGFALSRGLPQLSQSTIKTLALNLKVGQGASAANYIGHVVGFSDRISSVLVPQSFIDYCNKLYASGTPSMPSRLIVKAHDPSDKAFVHYLEIHNYITNAEQLRWSKLRAIVDVVSAGTGLLAALLMGISMLVFILFIELTIARARQSLTLLLQLGYSPRYLGQFMINRFVPLIMITVVISTAVVVVLQYAGSIYAAKQQLDIPSLPGWPVWLAMVLSTLILLVLVVRSIFKEIKDN